MTVELTSNNLHCHSYIPQTGTCPGDQTLTLKNLLTELTGVSHWQLLASYLEVPKKKRSKIGVRYDRDPERCKERMLDWWLKSTRQPSWERLAQALEKMGHHKDLVQRIWNKYIAPPPAEVGVGLINVCVKRCMCLSV